MPSPFCAADQFEDPDPSTERPALPPAVELDLGERGTTTVRCVEGPANAPTVLLIHGWAVTAAVNWCQVYRPLAEHANVVSFDLRGHGRGVRDDQPFRLVDAADDAVAVLDALGIDRAIVVGYSMGGTIAQLVAHRAPQRVSGLVLASTWTHGLGTKLVQQLFKASTIASKALALVPEKAQQGVVKTVWSAVAATKPSTRPAWFRDEVLQASMPYLVDASKEFATFDSRPWLSELTMPTGVLVTTADKLVLPSRQLDLTNHLPNAAVRTIDTDHDGCTLEPDVFVGPFVELVRTVANGTRST